MFSKLTALLQKRKLAKCGKNVTIHPLVTLVQPEYISLENEILLSEYTWLQGGHGLHVGNFVHIAPFVNIGGGGTCIIEDFATVSVGARIFAGTDLATGEGLVDSTIPADYRAVVRSYVHIRKYAFVTANVIVHPGVTIGEGAVVGSGSIVTEDIEPWTINLGQPAKPIKSRPKVEILILAEALYKRSGITPYIPSVSEVRKLTTNYYSPTEEKNVDRHVYRRTNSG